MGTPTLEQINKARTNARQFGDGTTYALDFDVDGNSYTFIPKNVANQGGVTAGDNTYLLPYFTDANNWNAFNKTASEFDLSGNSGLSKYLKSQGQSTSGFILPSGSVSFDSDVRTQPTSTLNGSLSGLKVDDKGQIAYGITGGAGSRYLTTSGEVHDPRIEYRSFLGDVFGSVGADIADFVNSDIGKAAMLAATAYAGGAFDPSSAAPELAGYDAAMADLAASTPAFGTTAAAGAGAGAGLDALAADNIDMGGGWNPATGTGDAATAAAAAETGVTSSAMTPHYDVPTPSGIDQLTQLAADNPMTTAGIAALAAPAVIGAQQPAQPEAPPPTPITYNINPYEFQRTYHDPADAVGKQYVQGQTSGERNWMTDTLTPKESYVKTEDKAAGGKISSDEGIMNLHNSAQQLAAQGRHGDSMLVHMTPKEVAGLESLAQEMGTHLPHNPRTGLPEASIFGDLNPVRIVQGKGAIGEALGPAAPILAGLALGPAGYGLTAMQAGLAVGGVSALASGNLQKGLMAGLGAYGGAALGGGLTGMGESAIGSQALDQSAAESARLGLDQSVYDKAAQDAVSKATTIDKLGAGTSYAAQNPTAALKTLGEGSAWKGAGVLGAAAAPILAGNMVQTATPPPQSQGLIRPYQFNRKVVTPTDMVQPTYQQGQSTRERNWFEDTLTPGTPYTAPGPEYKMAVGGYIDDSEPVVRMAGGGLPALGGYASGGNPRLLRGPGDGMSDNIPAVIGGKQPARLADGEFVVPADVVSHLGNGSTEAGAKQLYKMMDRIRQKRTGKKRQAPEVNPMKALPA